jgi:acetyl/propionyl-CoA carboxylase alpha subunit
MDLESFSIDQQIKVQGKSSKGKNRIMEHGDTWRVKNKWKKGHFPWIEEDSVLLESLLDKVTSIDIQVIEDEHFELV